MKISLQLLAVPEGTNRVKSAADWVAEIRKFVDHEKDSILDLARTVYLAKTSLRRGQFSELCRSRSLPFGKRKAEVLVVIGREFGGANAQTSAHLPSGWTILYPLAKLRRRDLETLIERGEIHPGITLAEAERLLARFNGQTPASARRSKVKLLLHHFCDFVRQTSGEWTAAERDLVRAELCQLALELKEADIPLPSVNRLFNASTSLAAGSPRN